MYKIHRDLIHLIFEFLDVVIFAFVHIGDDNLSRRAVLKNKNIIY